MASIVVELKTGKRASIDTSCGAVLAWVENEDGTASVVSITGHHIETKESFDAVLLSIAEAEAYEMGEEFAPAPPIANGGKVRVRKRAT